MRISIAAATAAITVLLAAPATAPAIIEPDVGMAGVTLGMKDEDVVAVLGQPTTRDGRRDHNGGLVVHWYFRPTRLKLELRQPEPNAVNVVVTRIKTRAGGERTAAGVGVGTPERRLRAVLAGVRCRNVPTGRRTARVCFTRGRSNGTAIGVDQTVFDISRRTRRIVAVSVSRFYD